MCGSVPKKLSRRFFPRQLRPTRFAEFVIILKGVPAAWTASVVRPGGSQSSRSGVGSFRRHHRNFLWVYKLPFCSLDGSIELLQRNASASVLVEPPHEGLELPLVRLEAHPEQALA